MHPDKDTLSHYLKASSALPVIYRDFVEVQGRRVADGGVAEPLPIREAYLRGARKIVVIRTRPANASKGCFLDSFLAFFFLRGYPALRARIHRLNRAYRDAVRFIRYPPPDASICEIAPHKASSFRASIHGWRIYRSGLQDGKKGGRGFPLPLADTCRRNLTESMHGAGSPQAQRIMIARLVNMKDKQKIAKELCGIVKGDQIR